MSYAPFPKPIPTHKPGNRADVLALEERLKALEEATEKREAR